MTTTFLNPFRPGAGHPPPYLAGREEEKQEFARLLEQRPVFANPVLTGLRGVGKTVLMETLKSIAIQNNWLWAGADLSESASLSEESIAVRILADLSPLVANIVVAKSVTRRIGFTSPAEKKPVRLDFTMLKRVYDHTPGLASDKLKTVLEMIWACLKDLNVRGVVLAYDEAQNLGDQSASRQYPLSLLLDVLQSIQKKELPFLLVLSGLPTLFPRLVDARTFAERMFHVMTLTRLNEQACRDAIVKPVESQNSPVTFTEAAITEIIRHSGGYPYFIQFLCREIFDSCLQQRATSSEIDPVVTIEQSIQKLDSDFFAGRWLRVTDRQRELLAVVAGLPNCEEEFSVQEIVKMAKMSLKKPFSASHITQLLTKLADNGLVYKNRHGRHSFAVPLLGSFIRRQGLMDGGQ